MAKPKTPANPILSSRIKETRMWIKNGSKMTQLELAEAIGVDEQTIRKYEKGNAGVPKIAVAAIAKVFGCCTEYLYGETNRFTIEEYLQEQGEIKNAVSHAVNSQNKAKEQWGITRRFFQEFLHYTVRDTHIREDDGSIFPAIVLQDSRGEKYIFSSRHDAEEFLLSYFDDAAKLLRYHLLDFANTKIKEEPTWVDQKTSILTGPNSKI